MRKIAVVCIIAVVVCLATAQANLGASLGQSLMSATPGAFGNLHAYVTRISTVQNAESITINTNQVAAHQGISRALGDQSFTPF